VGSPGSRLGGQGGRDRGAHKKHRRSAGEGKVEAGKKIQEKTFLL